MDELWGDFLPSVNDSDSEEEDEFDNLCFKMVDENFEAKRRFFKRRKIEKKKKAMMVLAVSAAIATLGTQNSPTIRQRLQWERHVAFLNSEGPNEFQKVCRMKESSFMKLCSLIDPHLQKDRAMAKLRTKIDQPITTEIMLHCLICWLAGGSHHDIRLHVGISKSAFHRCVHGVIRAIKKVEELRIKFPKAEDGWKKVAAGFANISSASIIDGCVGCVDGILLHIETPTKKEAGNI